MPDVNASPADQHPEGNPPAVDEQSRRTFSGLRNLAERITPSLVDVGSWIFGGLIAVNLVVLSALITVGPIDAAIQTSTAALAAALPLNVAGIVLLRLIKDVNDVGLDDLTLRAFQDAGFPNIDAYFPPPGERAVQQARRSRVAMLYSMGHCSGEHRVDHDGNVRGHVAHGQADRVRPSHRGHSERGGGRGRNCSHAAARVGRETSLTLRRHIQ